MLEIHIVPVLRDNYCFLIEDPSTKRVVIVDPGESQPVVEALAAKGLNPEAVWITHHHGDHIGGLPELLEHFGALPVLCSERDQNRVPGCTRTLTPNSKLEFAGEAVSILDLPGHAEGHIGYHFPESHHLFLGDVIFGASCGAVFGKTHLEMYHSVNRVKSLPPETKLWCGHEYTRNNLRFAKAVLGPDALTERESAFEVPSVPLLLSQELTTNPFMNLGDTRVTGFVGETEPSAVFKALRLAKDKF